jgi:lipid A 3-O-deacylase
MSIFFRYLVALPALGLISAPAMANEIFAGAYAHDVNTPLSIDIQEHGQDFQLGYRWNRIAGLGFIGGPAPYAFASVNDRGDTSLAAAGLAWKIGGPIFIRPGIGIAVHTGPSRRLTATRRTDLGSRVLFEPELGIGMQVAPRLTVEASWVHTSHAQIFGHQNPGLDMIGGRISLHLP